MQRRAGAEALLKRLRITERLDDDDVKALESLPVSIKLRQDGDIIVQTGDRPSHCCLVIKGLIIRAKNSLEGGRQILSLHQPGDIPDLQSLFLHVMDHEMIVAGECLLGFIPHQDLREVIRTRPNIASALWRETLLEAAIFREWILNVGQRSGSSRLAHFFLEIYTRLKSIGHTDGNSFRLPLTQVQLGEAIGMSAVHVNRILQTLRRSGLLEFEGGIVWILDEERLKQTGEFDPLYLHLQPSL
jgi:CRP-like cAMP-binding protein